MKTTLTAIIEKEADGYVALCPDMDVASQGDTVDEARKRICRSLAMLREKSLQNPWKKHGNIPL